MLQIVEILRTPKTLRIIEILEDLQKCLGRDMVANLGLSQNLEITQKIENPHNSRDSQNPYNPRSSRDPRDSESC